MAEMRAEDASEPGGGDTFRPAFDRLLDAIVDYPAPVLAAVNGPAIGAGMQLAVACDLRIAAFTATFSIPAARLGVFLSPANVQRLATLVGQGAARDLLLTARTLAADEAAAVGLERVEVLAVKVDVLADEREAAVNGLEERLSASDRHHRVEVRHHDGPARAYDAGQLGNGRRNELDVAERERAHREIEFAVVDR